MGVRDRYRTIEEIAQSRSDELGTHIILDLQKRRPDEFFSPSNYPNDLARHYGSDAASREFAIAVHEALAWTHWLLRHGRSVSIGLMQISTQHAADLGLSADQLFDPCTNVRAGAQILAVEYQRAAALDGEGQTALRRALSEYNSGSPIVGFDNGYVSIVADGEF